MQSCCVVIPCYNEADRFDAAKFKSFVSTQSYFNWILVNDGSNDATYALLDGIAGYEEKVFVLHLSSNKGKANAVQAGVNFALQAFPHCHAIGYLDADFAISLQDYQSLYSQFLASGKAIVFYSKYHQLAKAKSKILYRRIIGRSLSIINQLILNLKIADTQCGAKIFSKNFAKHAFKENFISGWLFDIEIFLRAIQFYGKKKINQHILEVPLQQLRQNNSSTIVLKSFLKLPLEYFKIVMHYRKNVEE